MNKFEMKNKISKISNSSNDYEIKIKFDDVKQILIKYKSIKDRVSKLNINTGSYTYFGDGPGINIGNNKVQIIEQLLIIIDDYKDYKEFICYLKIPTDFLGNLVNNIVSKWISPS